MMNDPVERKSPASILGKTMIRAAIAIGIYFGVNAFEYDLREKVGQDEIATVELATPSGAREAGVIIDNKTGKVEVYVFF